uniref:7TM_GPCR_Srx domain-containing protein n=1 Tax=Haemonchus contortus TaxID=6289 RepID=A0A7I4YYV9_HAECO
MGIYQLHYAIPMSVLSFAYCFAFWICLLSVGKVTYSPDQFAWSYGANTGSSVLSDLEFVVSVLCIALTFLVYIAIAITLYRKTRGMNTMRRSEKQLLLQATILFVILTSLISLWHFYYLILPDTVWTVVCINVYWIVYCGLNPIIYIIFSKSIRVAYMQFIGMRLKNHVTSISLVVGTTSRF